MDELAKERYDLAVERIREIREEKTVAEPYLEFFYKDSRISGRDDLPAEPGRNRRDEKNFHWKNCAWKISGIIRIFCRKIIRPLIQVRIMRQRYWEKIWVYC